MDERDVEGKNRKRKDWGIEIKMNCKRFPTISESPLLLQNLSFAVFNELLLVWNQYLTTKAKEIISDLNV
jgi:hypothetical protein